MLLKPVYGHNDVKLALRNLQAQTLLFTGQEGVGRRLLARWFAAWLNCQEPFISSEGKPNEEPCGKCASCKVFLTDSHPDYREISPEQETKTGKLSRRPQFRIDDLVHREGGNNDPLGSWLEKRPHFKKRVGVIDHAEALNASAANAFLKFLEEPPSYVTIILIAPSQQAILPTIASRATPVRFGTVKFDKDLSLKHPATRLGRYGDIALAKDNESAFQEVFGLIEDYIKALTKSLENAFELADGLEKRWLSEGVFSVPELLRARISQESKDVYAAAVVALENCEKALASYASPSLALQVLTLELRNIMLSRLRAS